MRNQVKSSPYTSSTPVFMHLNLTGEKDIKLLTVSSLNS